MNLYELSNSYQAILSMQEDLDEDLFLDTLSSIEEPLNEKVENIAKFIRNLEAEKTMFKEESQRLAEKATSRENKIKSLKRYLQDSLEAAGLDKVKGQLFTVAIQNSPMSLNVVDERKIKLDYFEEQKPKLNRKLLLDALKSGAEVEGAEIKQGRHIRIR